MRETNAKAEKVLKEFKKYIEFECKKFFVPGFDLDDLKQEISYHLISNIEKYDESQSSRKHWVLTIIRRKLIDLWRQEVKLKRLPRDPENNTLLIQHLSYRDNEDGKVTELEIDSSLYIGHSEFYERPDEKLYYKELILKVRNRLSPLAQLVFDVKLNPPIGLFHIVEKENKSRRKRKEAGRTIRQVYEATNELIAEFMGLPDKDITDCTREIEAVTLKVCRRTRKV